MIETENVDELARDLAADLAFLRAEHCQTDGLGDDLGKGAGG